MEVSFYFKVYMYVLFHAMPENDSCTCCMWSNSYLTSVSHRIFKAQCNSVMLGVKKSWIPTVILGVANDKSKSILWGADWVWFYYSFNHGVWTDLSRASFHAVVGTMQAPFCSESLGVWLYTILGSRERHDILTLFLRNLHSQNIWNIW